MTQARQKRQVITGDKWYTKLTKTVIRFQNDHFRLIVWPAHVVVIIQRWTKITLGDYVYYGYVIYNPRGSNHITL